MIMFAHYERKCKKKEFKQQKLFSDLSLKVNNFHECILAIVLVAFSYKFIYVEYCYCIGTL